MKSPKPSKATTKKQWRPNQTMTKQSSKQFRAISAHAWPSLTRTNNHTHQPPQHYQSQQTAKDSTKKTGTTNTTAVINSTKIKKYWHTIEFSNNTHTHNQASATETQPNTATNTASTQHEQPSTPRASDHHNTNRVAATPINLHTPQPTHKPPAQTHKSRGRGRRKAKN
ncbi:hypothetical protein CPELA_02295 [Corynebacterium pelargi]|uniref:Uncharacterized protein n=1 Tax=Corynebacterium pelargi TaxID=1471400 RepID=A0A410W707_9CORY|nr:hypothetical protein CPELA_02295 [Corynebacterium pelargi]